MKIFLAQVLRKISVISGNRIGGIMLVKKLPGPNKMTSACAKASTASGVACTIGLRKIDCGSSLSLSILTSPTMVSPELRWAARCTGASDIGMIKERTCNNSRIRFTASIGRMCISSNAFNIKLPRLCPASSPLPAKRYSNRAEAVLGSVIIWFKQFLKSPQAIPPCSIRIRPVEPPLSVVVTMPVKRSFIKLKADIMRPKPCPPPIATICFTSSKYSWRL